MKKITKIHSFFILCFLLISTQVISQNNIEYNNVSQDWSLIANNNGVNIYVMKTTCKLDEKFKPSTWLFYKLENTTTENKSVEFTPIYTYQEGCVNCDNNTEYSLEFQLEANETLNGDCGFADRNLTFCIHNPNLSGGWKLLDIELSQLTVK
ncbi:MAG: hypothetical protein ACPGU5_06500 [Lishizhenia sp.]